MIEKTAEVTLYEQTNIQNCIHIIRDVPIILDKDLARIYNVSISQMNRQVKRNIERFPEDFMFQITKEEFSRCHFGILKIEQGRNLKYLPYAFTEQGVSMLAGLLRSETAIQANIAIIRAFVAMRHYLSANNGILQRLDLVEQKQLTTEKQITDTNLRINDILDRLDDGKLKSKIGIFFDGQMFDANGLIEELISKATKRIILIDDYVTSEILARFHQRKKGVTVDCFVKRRFATIDLQQKFQDFHSQYPTENIQLHTFEKSHDRWLIIDDIIYHFGASIKDLGKRWFSVDVVSEITADELLSKIE